MQYIHLFFIAVLVESCLKIDQIDLVPWEHGFTKALILNG